MIIVVGLMKLKSERVYGEMKRKITVACVIMIYLNCVQLLGASRKCNTIRSRNRGRKCRNFGTNIGGL